MKIRFLQPIQRVDLRAKAGGHYIPEDVVKRRYHRSIYNFMNWYIPLAGGVSKALERHKKLGEPIAVMRDGKVTIIQPEDIKVPPYPDDSELEDCWSVTWFKTTLGWYDKQP